MATDACGGGGEASADHPRVGKPRKHGGDYEGGVSERESRRAPTGRSTRPAQPQPRGDRRLHAPQPRSGRQRRPARNQGSHARHVPDCSSDPARAERALSRRAHPYRTARAAAGCGPRSVPWRPGGALRGTRTLPARISRGRCSGGRPGPRLGDDPVHRSRRFHLPRVRARRSPVAGAR